MWAVLILVALLLAAVRGSSDCSKAINSAWVEWRTVSPSVRTLITMQKSGGRAVWVKFWVNPNADERLAGMTPAPAASTPPFWADSLALAVQRIAQTLVALPGYSAGGVQFVRAWDCAPPSSDQGGEWHGNGEGEDA